MLFDKNKHLVIIITLFLLFSISIIPESASAQINDEWKKSYGGSSKDIAKSVIFTDDGGLIIAGSTRSFGPGKLYNFHIVKTNVFPKICQHKIIIVMT